MAGKRTILFPAPALALACDFGITMVGQPAVYWSGAYEQANEASPIFRPFIEAGPLLFFLATLFWLGIFLALIHKLPELPAIGIMLAFVLGHLWGTSTWLVFQYRSPGYMVTLGLFLGVGMLCAWSLQRYYRGPGSQGSAA